MDLFLVVSKTAEIFLSFLNSCVFYYLFIPVICVNSVYWKICIVNKKKNSGFSKHCEYLNFFVTHLWENDPFIANKTSVVHKIYGWIYKQNNSVQFCFYHRILAFFRSGIAVLINANTLLLCHSLALCFVLQSVKKKKNTNYCQYELTAIRFLSLLQWFINVHLSTLFISNCKNIMSPQMKDFCSFVRLLIVVKKTPILIMIFQNKFLQVICSLLNSNLRLINLLCLPEIRI